MPLDKYRIFASEDRDWYVAARLDGKKVSIVSRGHDYDRALEDVLADAGLSIQSIDKDMSDGDYDPTPDDWQ